MFSNGIGRRTALLLFGFILSVLWIGIDAPAAYADDVVGIFDVRKTLPLDPSEPVFHDFYINAGPEAGLKKGMFVTVVRRLPIHDPVKNKAQATLSVDVARLKIIHVERKISVARLVPDTLAEDRPILEFDGVMIGDELDLTTVSMEPPKTAPKKRTPAASESTPSEAVTATVPVSAPLQNMIATPLPVPATSPAAVATAPAIPSPAPATSLAVPVSAGVIPAPTANSAEKAPAQLLEKGPKTGLENGLQKSPEKAAEKSADKMTEKAIDIDKDAPPVSPAIPTLPSSSVPATVEKSSPTAPAPGMVRAADDDPYYAS